MKNLTLTLSFIVIALTLHAQSAERYVISSSGGEMTSSQYSVEYTLGETVISTVENSNYMLTQGFHQPISVPTSVPEETSGEITLYPNPTSEKVFLDLPEELNDVDVKIFTLYGQKVLSKSHLTSESNINLSGLASGTYIVSIINPNNQSIEKRIKIQKIK